MPYSRLFLFVLCVVLVTACGEEAPPRIARPTSSPPAPAPVRIPAPIGDAQAAPDPRTLGDPNAPITVIEYADYQ
jgi:hypothetical protein